MLFRSRISGIHRFQLVFHRNFSSCSYGFHGDVYLQGLSHAFGISRGFSFGKLLEVAISKFRLIDLDATRFVYEIDAKRFMLFTDDDIDGMLGICVAHGRKFVDIEVLIGSDEFDVAGGKRRVFIGEGSGGGGSGTGVVVETNANMSETNALGLETSRAGRVERMGRSVVRETNIVAGDRKSTRLNSSHAQ